MDINQKFNVYDDGIGICECSHHPAHYTIPSFRRYCISETGEIFSHIGETRPLKWYYQEIDGKDSYRRTSLTNDNGVRKNVSRHIAVLSAHKGFDNNPERKYVNHKDCVPGNDILTNLEWCTHEENMRHAWGNHRMEMLYQPLDVWNIITGEIKKYATISEFIRIVEENPRTIFRRLARDNAIIYGGKYRYKRSHEEWSSSDTASFKQQYSYLGKAINVYDLRDHSIKKFDTVILASKALDIRPSLIANNCLKLHTTPCKGYIFRYGENVKWPVFDLLQCELLRQQEYPQVMLPGCALFDKTNTCVFIGTISQAAEKLGLGVRTLQNYISAGNNVYEYKICAIRKYGLSEVTDACENIQP